MADKRPDDDELYRPVAEHLICQAEIAALGVRRVRHGLSVLLIPVLDGAPVIIPQVVPLRSLRQLDHAGSDLLRSDDAAGSVGGRPAALAVAVAGREFIASFAGASRRIFAGADLRL
ncbi:hypothetical protein MTY59_32620 [Mycobacterium senriense]|uniref:Uncharacterized protein n=1 Tax=Mycobacterium senriense TaxID=2775496 RepID=A0ABN6IIQ9_9MYCO|nr:hypothetical protein MTY59_32620 [Mycobacterium senriense]